MTSRETVDFICKVLDEKKGLDIVILNLEGRTSICDYFVICTGTSSTHVKALSEALEEKAGEAGLKLKSREGYREGRWIALDYGDVVVHIFNDETRLFYHLERLWAYGNNLERYK
jgi:ribosome-associated protein